MRAPLAAGHGWSIESSGMAVWTGRPINDDIPGYDVLSIESLKNRDTGELRLRITVACAGPDENPLEALDDIGNSADLPLEALYFLRNAIDRAIGLGSAS